MRKGPYYPQPGPCLEQGWYVVTLGYRGDWRSRQGPMPKREAEELAERLNREEGRDPARKRRRTVKTRKTRRDPPSKALIERFRKQRAKGKPLQTAYQYAKHGDKELYAAYEAWRRVGYSAKAAKHMAEMGPPSAQAFNPTLQEMRELFEYYRFDDAGQRASKLHKKMESSSDEEKVMKLADELLEMHGIEAVHVPEYQVDRYYYDVVAVYVNTGDTYLPTLIYDTENSRYSIEGWGDFLEQWEDEHPQYRDRG
jgi:hypothetical protein